jgi:hypothetical protein
VNFEFLTLARFKAGIDEQHFADLLTRVLGATVTEENARRLFSVFDKGTCGGSSEEGGSTGRSKGRDERSLKEE